MRRKIAVRIVKEFGLFIYLFPCVVAAQDIDSVLDELLRIDAGSEQRSQAVKRMMRDIFDTRRDISVTIEPTIEEMRKANEERLQKALTKALELQELRTQNAKMVRRIADLRHELAQPLPQYSASDGGPGTSADTLLAQVNWLRQEVRETEDSLDMSLSERERHEEQIWFMLRGNSSEVKHVDLLAILQKMKPAAMLPELRSVVQRSIALLTPSTTDSSSDPTPQQSETQTSIYCEIFSQSTEAISELNQSMREISNNLNASIQNLDTFKVRTKEERDRHLERLKSMKDIKGDRRTR